MRGRWKGDKRNEGDAEYEEERAVLESSKRGLKKRGNENKKRRGVFERMH